MDKNITCEEAGSIAQASLELNRVFEAAQAACDQYTENIRARSAHLEELCLEKERETEEKCERMIEEAREQSQAYWNEVNEKVEALMSQSAILRELLSEKKG